MADMLQLLPLLGAGGVAGWAGNVSLHWLKARGDRDNAQVNADVQLEQHRDKLTFDLLSAARTELAAARAEVAELRPVQSRLSLVESRLAHFEEALGHIQALLEAKQEPERTVAEKYARAFVKRMQRLSEAHGTIINEMQREQSATALAPNREGAGK